MLITKPVIQLAKERALFRFSALAVPMLKDAADSLTQAREGAKSGADQPAALANQFLRQDGPTFVKRFETSYRDALERAMGTMYSDLRRGPQKVSASQLKLIDDETVTKAIEVDRLLLRMREADDEDLSRLNIMIAQMHGHEEVKERENPFRPYLIAHSLHEVLREMVPDEAAAKILFEHLSNALAKHLSDYYAAIRSVFESSGVQARLLTQPSRMVKHQRYAGNSLLEMEESNYFNLRVLPGLQRMSDLLEDGLPATEAGSFSPGATAGNAAQSAPGMQVSKASSLQEFVGRIFNQSATTEQTPGAQFLEDDSEAAAAAHGRTGPTRSVLPAASTDLVYKLKQFQRLAARGELAINRNAADEYQIFTFGQQIDDSKISRMERTTIDVVGMLFDIIQKDDQLPAPMRQLIARLQIPFLKAAMFNPQLLQQSNHPARQLINRMASTVMGLDPAAPANRKTADEILRIVTKILSAVDADVGIFSECLDEFERFLEEQMRNADSHSLLGAEAIQAAEDVMDQLAATTAVLRDLLTPLRAEKLVFAFIVQTWTHVLCRETLGRRPPFDLRFRKLVPDLVWSVQAKSSPADRTMLMRLLPDLVTGLKDGLLLIGLSEAERAKRLDPFVTLHMDLLRSNRSVERRKMRNLEELREYFSAFVRELPDTGGKPVEASREIQSGAIGMAFRERDVSATLSLDFDIVPLESDAEWLEPMQTAVHAEAWSDDSYQPVRLVGATNRRTIYMFKREQDGKLIIYSSYSLIKALREGSVRLLESAPVFERAIATLLSDAEAMSPQ
ncbi:hypothetical protein BH11PSE11_BH11PSE11_03350 [soil metagenome]